MESKLPYIITIGLEVHVELNTASKMFSTATNEPFNAEANTHLTPVCIGMPGTLPVPNRRAIEQTILFGLAFGCTIPKESKFDRKHYFYPDLPKGYQISQFDQPFCQGGVVEFGDQKVRLTRIHLEEDAGKLLHGTAVGISAVDLNRAGVPLMEIVSEPDITSPQMAREYLKAVRDYARHLKVSEADMEKGQLRCDANVSITAEFDGVKVQSYISEIKNLNSFRMVERATTYEAQRIYEDLLKNITQRERKQKMTVGWNDTTGQTILQRDKEGSADYRYFPEPDIPPFRLYDSDNSDTPPTELPNYEQVIDVALIRQLLPAMPSHEQAQLQEQGIAENIGSVIVKKPWMKTVWQQLMQTTEAQDKVWLERGLLKKAATLLVHDATEGISGIQLLNIAQLSLEQQISSDVPKKAFSLMAKNPNENALTLVKAQGWLQQSDDGALLPIVNQVIAENPQPVADFKAGKEASIGFLVGKVMQLSGGQANPAKAQQLLREALK